MHIFFTTSHHYNTVKSLNLSFYLVTGDDALLGSGGELITSSVSHRDSSVVLENEKSDGTSLSSSDGT